MFAQRLHELRKEHNISQIQVAKALFVSVQRISDWENGKSECSFENLKALAKFFGVSADYLLGLEN